jgi:hypothetical protein
VGKQNHQATAILQLSGEALRPFCRKAYGRDPRSRSHRHWTFSIPRVLRGLFERERSLLGLLSQTAYASISKSFQALLDRKDVRPGCVLSLQTYGAYGANFNPHCHGLISDGAFSPEGEFLPLPSLDASAVMQLFRRLLLLRLHKAERLSQSFMQNLLSWAHPGFSVFAGPPVEAAEIAALESQARYITRPVLAMDALEKLDDGSLVLETPPDPRTGATSISLDPLEWIHRITSHIPDPGRHCQRFYGAYSNRGRISVAAPDDETAGLPAAGLPERDNSDVSREARSTWARLIKKIFEADPLLCACGGRMRIISFITDPRVVDRILRHRESPRSKAQDPFETLIAPGDWYVTFLQNGKQRGVIHKVISKDGKTMTQPRKGVDAQGKPFEHIEVYDRQ